MPDKAELLPQFRELTGRIDELERQIAELRSQSSALIRERSPIALQLIGWPLGAEATDPDGKRWRIAEVRWQVHNASPVVEWIKAHWWRKEGGWSETVREFRPNRSGYRRALLIESLTRVAQEEVDEKAVSPALEPEPEFVLAPEPTPALEPPPAPPRASLHFEF